MNENMNENNVRVYIQKPLAIEELWEMEGQPVWVDGADWDRWAIIHVPPDDEDGCAHPVAVSYTAICSVIRLKEDGAKFYRMLDPSDEVGKIKTIESMDMTEARRVARHNELRMELGELYKRKNHDYGNSFAQTYREWGRAAAGVRMSDKLNRFIALSKSAAVVDDETIKDTLMDLANYAIMTIIEIEGEE